MHGSDSEPLWTLPTTTDLTMTDRRLVFSCRKYTEESQLWGKWGVGPVDIAIEAVASAVRAITAGKARRGKQAAGQLRFEWPTSVGLGGVRKPDWTRLFVFWRDEHAPFRLDLPLGTPLSRQVGELLAPCIARYRLANRHLLTPGEDSWDLLNRQSVRPVERVLADVSAYELPGSLRYPMMLLNPSAPARSKSISDAAARLRERGKARDT
jgi:hypothetical protein